MSEHILVSIAWPYANAKIHVGNVTGSHLPGDICARYHRLAGNHVLMVSGSDSHGTPITVVAEREGKSPRKVFEHFHHGFLEMFQRLGISYDLFTHTDTENHHRVSQDFFLALLQKGYLYRQIQEGTVKELNLIMRADMDGSIEVLSDSLASLDTKEVKINIIHKAVGVINESDILLASASNAVVIGFHVSITPKASHIAKTEGVDVRFYDVIYHAIDDVKAAMAGLLEPEIIEKELGEAEVRQIFRVSKIGTVAGSYVKSGVVKRNALVRVKRDDEIIYKGTINSLKRFKDDAREVLAGFECGIGVGGFEDFNEGDLLEIYQEEEISRTID